MRGEVAGFKVTRVIVIVERMDGDAEALVRAGYPFLSLLTIQDFAIDPRQ